MINHHRRAISHHGQTHDPFQHGTAWAVVTLVTLDSLKLFSWGFCMADVVKLPIPASLGADEHAQAETERDQRLFAWADAVLKALGLDKAVIAAQSVEE